MHLKLDGRSALVKRDTPVFCLTDVHGDFGNCWTLGYSKKVYEQIAPELMEEWWIEVRCNSSRDAMGSMGRDG